MSTDRKLLKERKMTEVKNTLKIKIKGKPEDLEAFGNIKGVRQISGYAFEIDRNIYMKEGMKCLKLK